MARGHHHQAPRAGGAVQPPKKAPPLTPGQQQVLLRLLHAGGCLHYTLLTQWVATALPAWSSGILTSLERRGLITIQRRWGAWDYGQPGLIELTAAGRDVARAGDEEATQPSAAIRSAS